MAARKPVRVLISGDVRGKWGELNGKVKQVCSKSGAFQLLLCVGQFFEDKGEFDGLKSFLESGEKAAVPTYFVGSNAGEEDVVALLDQYPEANIKYLGKQGVVKLQELTVAYYDDLAISSLKDETAQNLELQLLRDQASSIEGEVDLLLTNKWPQSIVHKGGVVSGVVGSKVVKNLAMLLRPRYHIAASEGQFYARPPYENLDLGAGAHVTRFIGLGAVGNSTGAKFLHALGLKPASSMSRETFLTKPANTTPFPFSSAMNQPGLARVGMTLDGGQGRGGGGGGGLGGDSQRDHSLKRLRHQADFANEPTQDWRWGRVKQPQAGNQDQARKKSKFDKGSVVIDSRKSVFARNLPYRATEEDIIKFFSPSAGTIVDIRRGYDNRGNLKGYAQIQFETLDQMEASCSLNETQLMGRPIYVEPAGNNKNKQTQRESHPVADCWFCLSNPNADTDLVASVGSECYCALDKGPITPFHVLVVPIDHISCTLQLKDTTFAEVVKYTKALSLCFASQGLELFLFERYLKLKGREGGNHCHFNIVGIPKAAAADLKDQFKQASTEIGFEFLDVVKEKEAGLGGANFRDQMRELVGDMEYILLLLPDGTSMVHPIMRGERIPYNFIRDVLARTLGCPERADWKACRQSKDQELDSVALFKAKFSSYDQQ